MQFIESISKERFDRFVDRHPYGSFLQTYDWGKFKSLHEWTLFTVGVEEKNELIGAALLLARRVPGTRKKILYSPRGILVDYRNDQVLSFFLHGLKRLMKRENAIFLRIDPIIKTRCYDLEGNPVEGEHNLDIVDILKGKGFLYKGEAKGFEGFQPKYVMKLDIQRDLEAVFSSFHKKTQYNIRLAAKRGILIEEGKKEDLSQFHEIMKITGERDGFTVRSLSYFEEMYDFLEKTDRMKLFMARYVPAQALKEIAQNKQKIGREWADLEEKNKSLTPGRLKEKTEKRLGQLKEEMANLEIQIEGLQKDVAAYPKGRIVSGTIAMRTDTTVCYLYGASDNEYRNYMANYLIQWEMIRWAKERGAVCYDFRGISGNLSEEDPLYGLYRFKKGFHPELIEYLGEFDWVADRGMYFMFERALPIFKKVRKKFLRR